MAQNFDNTQKIVDIHGNTVTYINPSKIVSDKFGLKLIGNNFNDDAEIKEVINENFIVLTQNFYDETPPTNPVLGQNWCSSTDNLTYKWFGQNWVQSDKDVTYDSFMFIKYDMTNVKDFVLDEFVFNFTMNNIKLYNQNMSDVKFVIDPFDSRKLIIRDKNVTMLYILVFHPKDRISNPILNKKLEIFTASGQTQFDISTFLDNNEINTLSVALNDTMLKNNEFFIANNILNIDGLIYRVRKDNKLTVWKYGGSLTGYYSSFKIHTSRSESFLRIPKFFKNIEQLELIDVDNKTTINPIETIEYDNFVHFEFLNKKNVVANIHARII